MPTDGAFLCGINPALSVETFHVLLREHSRLTGEQIEMRARKDFGSDNRYYNEAREKALSLADVPSGSVLRKFKPGPRISPGSASTERKATNARCFGAAILLTLRPGAEARAVCGRPKVTL